MGLSLNIYCDESCHLPNDGSDVMVLGALSCPKQYTRDVSLRLKDLKIKHRLPISSEIKWTKISPSNRSFYEDVINYFFDNDHLHFRAVIAKGKTKLDHGKYNQDHDTWYYKIYFLLLHHLLDPSNIYQIFIDIKDTKSNVKTAKLHEVLCNANYDFDRKIIQSITTVHSNNTPCVQLADLLIGALSYLHRDLKTSNAKQAIIDLIKKRSRKTLVTNTLLKDRKFNLFIWEPSQNDKFRE